MNSKTYPTELSTNEKDMRQILNTYLLPIIKVIPNINGVLKQKDNLYLCTQISNMFNIIKNGGSLKKDDDGTIIVSISKPRRISFGLKNEEIPEVEEYKVKITNNRIIIEEKKNRIVLNDKFTSNVTNNVIAVYHSFLKDGFINYNEEIRESNRTNAFNDHDNDCFVRSLSVVRKGVFDNNWNIIDNKTILGYQKNYKNYLEVSNFMSFDPPLLNSLSENDISGVYKTNDTGELIPINKDRSI